jgi:uncharacterized membrane protein YidH (DUF202 family)
LTRGPGQQRPVLAEQRTALAWNRSSLAILATAVALGRAGVVGGERWLGFAAAGVLVALAAVVWRAGELELFRRLHENPANRHGSRDRLLLLPAAAVISAAVAFVVAVTT